MATDLSYERTLRIADCLEQKAAEFPDRLAIKCGSRSLTYTELAARVEKCAGAFLAAGLTTGDRIAVLAPQREEVLVTFLAAAKLGLLWLGLNTKYQLRELRQVVEDSQPSAIFGVKDCDGRDFQEELSVLREENPGIRLWLGFDGADGYGGDFQTWVNQLSSISSSDALSRATAEVTKNMAAMLVYTSGSSGRPKGVLLRQKDLLQRSITQNQQFAASPYPRSLNPLPINHIGGMQVISMYILVGGGTVILAERLSIDDYVDAIIEKEINVVALPPAVYVMLIEHPRFSVEILNSLEWMVWSGAAMPRDVVDLLFQADCQLGTTYGSTETCGSVTYAIKEPGNQEIMSRTIGRPVPEEEVRICNGETSVQPGESGEIQVRPNFCMERYLDNPEATAATFTSDGWFKTGDIGLLRADGFIEFTSRLSEMFKSGGYNVYPREVEQTIEKHPKVGMCAVVEVSDRVYDQVGWAYLVPSEGGDLSVEELREWCRSEMANYKLPKRFFIMDELPLLAIGKVDKVALRKMELAELAQPVKAR